MYSGGGHPPPRPPLPSHHYYGPLLLLCFAPESVCAHMIPHQINYAAPLDSQIVGNHVRCVAPTECFNRLYQVQNWKNTTYIRLIKHSLIRFTQKGSYLITKSDGPYVCSQRFLQRFLQFDLSIFGCESD